MGRFTESVVEDAMLDWFKSLGWTLKHGPHIAPGELFTERADYGQVVLAQRLRHPADRIYGARLGIDSSAAEIHLPR